MAIDALTPLRLIAGIILLASNGFFVGTEFALTRVRQFSEEEFQKNRGLRKAWEMTDQLEIFLSSCQVGITISSVALGIIAEPAVTAVLGELFVAIGLATQVHSTISIIISVSIINILHIIVAEQIPTYLGVERAKQVTKYCAYPLYYWAMLMYPVVIGCDRIAKLTLGLFGVEITRSWTEGEDKEEQPKDLSELRGELGKLMSGLPLTEERKQEVINAIEISETPVEDIMVHSDQISYLSTDNSLDETIKYVQNHPHTRYPLCSSKNGEDGIVVGLVYSASILQNVDELREESTTLEDISTDIPIVPPSKPVSEVIDIFQEEKQELAIISTSSDRPLLKRDVQGIVTSTDAMEEITGELEDPLESES